MEIDLDDGARTQNPLANGRVTSSLGLRVGSQKMIIHNGTVGRLVLNHDSAIFVDVNPEMNVTDSFQGIVDKNDVASHRISTKDKAGLRVLEVRRQT
jgi:hypothetical protein